MRNISTARARVYTKERRVFGEERQMIDRRFLGIKRGINVASYRFIETSLSSPILVIISRNVVGHEK